MPTCAECRREYHEDWDACPDCAPGKRKEMRSLVSNVYTIMAASVLLLILSALAACSSLAG